MATEFPRGGLAIVIGATGGIGSALVAALQNAPGFAEVVGLGRTSDPPLDLLSEESISQAASEMAGIGRNLRLVIDATGILRIGGAEPEKSLKQIDPARMAEAYAINAIGPALLMKHFLPMLPREGKAVFATLSAKVGSIGDNRLGGWISYRASKAALNQIVRTASIELRRRAPDAICVAMHPGTVDTGLSASFAKTGLDVHTPAEAAANLLRVIHMLDAAQSGDFFDWRGEPLVW